MALSKSIDLGYEGEEPVRIRGHEFLLHELVKNLLDNALRYTPGGGHVTVRVATREDRAVLAVEDTGIGIPEPERERVFDRFYQIPGRDPAGCGLGLAIVKEIADLHGATVHVRDGQGGRGTAFELNVGLA